MDIHEGAITPPSSIEPAGSYTSGCQDTRCPTSLVMVVAAKTRTTAWSSGAVHRSRIGIVEIETDERYRTLHAYKPASNCRQNPISTIVFSALNSIMKFYIVYNVYIYIHI